MKTSLLCLALTASLACAEEPGSRCVVHEWGTFTSLQDETGSAIGGINTDDEPVPMFVHRLAHWFLISPSEAPPTFFQGAPSCHPDVTMRLETPVLYFHPPADWKPQPIDVHVSFRGGWLTEFFPAAEAKAPNFDAGKPDRLFDLGPDYGSFEFGHLRRDRSGELFWKKITLVDTGDGPKTEERVWLAPREVAAKMVETSNGEREKFLFYRGVGNVDAGLRVSRNAAEESLVVQRAKIGTAAAESADQSGIRAAWLVEIRPDGGCAFRSLDSSALSASRPLTLPDRFSEDSFSPTGLAQLHREMETALVAAGLYADEAKALLQTWEVSYFKSHGLRLFYLLTPGEIDRLLPLEISPPADVTRVMVGRIEIVTPGQRALLAKIAAGPAPILAEMRGVTAASDSPFFQNPKNVATWHAVMEGRVPFRELGLPMPELFTAYLQLGRFRNALLLDEAGRRPTTALAEFIKINGFDAYHVAGTDR